MAREGAAAHRRGLARSSTVRPFASARVPHVVYTYLSFQFQRRVDRISK